MTGGSQLTQTCTTHLRSTKKMITRRNISMLSEEECDVLECVYKLNHFPPDVVRKEIAGLLKIETAEINDWFQKRRRQPKGSSYMKLVVNLRF